MLWVLLLLFLLVLLWKSGRIKPGWITLIHWRAYWWYQWLLYSQFHYVSKTSLRNKNTCSFYLKTSAWISIGSVTNSTDAYWSCWSTKTSRWKSTTLLSREIETNGLSRYLVFFRYMNFMFGNWVVRKSSLLHTYVAIVYISTWQLLSKWKIFFIKKGFIQQQFNQNLSMFVFETRKITNWFNLILARNRFWDCGWKRLYSRMFERLQYEYVSNMKDIRMVIMKNVYSDVVVNHRVMWNNG